MAPLPVGWQTDAGPAAAAGYAAAPWEPYGDQPRSAHRAQPYPGSPYPDPAREHVAAQVAAALFDAADEPGGTAVPHTAEPVRDEGPESESVLGPASIAPTLHRGRAARRRQMERWKKNRRRAAAATAVALFGGGVTVASMSHSGKGSPAAASAGTPVVPTSLHTDTAASGHLADGSAGSPVATPSDAPHAGSTAHRHDVQATYPSTDGITSVPQSVIAAARPVSYAVTTHTAPVGAAPAPSTTPAPTTPASSDSAAPAGSTAAPAGSPASAPATQPQQQSQHPAQSGTTTPSTPPQQQLCVLIVCLG